MLLSPLTLPWAPAQLLWLGVALVCAYAVGLAYWRLVHHPLAKFPGPKLAAVSRLYEIYFDVCKGGQYMWEIKRLHSIYGPVVRVAPDELHILDPDFLDHIYAGWGRPRDKHHFQISNIPGTIFGSEFHADHRRHRQVYSGFFTKQSVRSLEPHITARLAKLHARVREHAAARRPLNLKYALFGWACDTVSFLCFGKDWGHLDHPDFNAAFTDASLFLIQSFKILTHMKWAIPLITVLPAWLVRPLHAKVALILEYKPRVRAAVVDMMRRSARSGAKWSRGELPSNILHYIQQDGSIDPAFKTVNHLARDAELIVGAGEGSVSAVVLYALAHLHLSPRTLRRLRAELAEAAAACGKGSVHLAVAELESLPYLTACIREGLRLQHGFTKRMPRIAPTEDLVCGDYVIPRGTAMSTMAPLLHLNPAVFPEPESFIPERWLDDAQLAALQKRDEKFGLRDCGPGVPQLRAHSIAYMQAKIMAFSRGSRICLGFDLAWAEMYLALASLVRAFDFELHETDVRDVTLYADGVVALARPGSKGIQAMVTACRELEFV